MSRPLFESYDLAGLTLKNRIVMAPMTRSRAVNASTPNDLMAAYHGRHHSDSRGYVASAQFAVEAGFDGIELHPVNG